MKRYLLIGLAALGLSANASAQDDVTIILGNLEATTEALSMGLEDTLTTLAETQSAVDTSAALGDTAVDTGSALVAGTEQFGALGLGLLLGNNAVQTNLNPFLTAIDDPTEENINNAFNPEDLNTIASNLENVPDALIEGTPFGGNTGLKDGVIALLEGDLIADPPLFFGPSAVTSPLLGLTAASNTLFEGTNYGQAGGSANLPGTLGITTLVVAGATGGQLEELEENVAPLFEAAEPLTTPLIEAIEDNL